MKKLVLILFLHAAVFAHAGEQQEYLSASQAQLAEIDSGNLLQAITRAGFSEEQKGQVANQFLTKDHQEIIGEAMRSKIYEGLAKGIGPQAIIQATARVRDRYQFAMQLASQLDAKNFQTTGKSYVDCLAAGLTQEDAKKIAAGIQQRKTSLNSSESQQVLIDEAIITARDMVRQGVSSQTTTAILENALAHGYNGASLKLLRHSLRQKEAADIEEVALRYQAAIRSGVRAEDLKTQTDPAGKAGGNQEAGTGQGSNSGSGSGGSSGGSNGGSNGGGSGGNAGNGGSGNGGGGSGENGGNGGGNSRQ